MLDYVYSSKKETFCLHAYKCYSWRRTKKRWIIDTYKEKSVGKQLHRRVVNIAHNLYTKVCALTSDEKIALFYINRFCEDGCAVKDREHLFKVYLRK